MKTTACFWFAVAVACALQTTFAQELDQRFVSPVGYEINLPVGWKRIDKETLEKGFKELSGGFPNARLLQEAVDGFQLESSQGEPGYPNITVTVARVGKTSFQDLKEMASSLQGVQRGADSGFAGNSFQATASVDSAGYDEQGHFLRITSTASAPGVGRIRGITVVFPMDFGILEFQFFSTEGNYSQYAALFSRVIRGIKKTVPLAEGVGIPPGQPTKRLLTDEDIGLTFPPHRTPADSATPTPVSAAPASQPARPTATAGAEQDWVPTVVLASLACGIVLLVMWQLWLYFSSASRERLNQPQGAASPDSLPSVIGYFILQDDEPEGPYSLEELRSFWSDGSITRETFYCEEGYQEWLRLENIASQLESSSPAAPALPPDQNPELAPALVERTSAEQDSANLAPSVRLQGLPSGGITARAVRWDIGWPALAVGALAICSIYWFVVDPAFVESLMASPTPGTGRITGGILLLSVGTAVGVPLWCCVWFLNHAASGRARFSFKPFTLAGMVALLVLGWAGQAERTRVEEERLQRKQAEKQQFVSGLQLDLRLRSEDRDSALRRATLHGTIRNGSPAELHALHLKVYFFRPDHTLVDTESVSIFDLVGSGEAKSVSKDFFARGVPSEFTWSYAIEKASFQKDGEYYP